MSTGSYLKPFRPPAALKPGNTLPGGGKKSWARRPPPKLCTSGFLSGSWKPPKRVTVAKPATGRLAKRCREVAAANPPTVANEDDLSVESTAADSALWEAVAEDCAELDETDGCEEIDFSDVRMDEASEEAVRAAKRARHSSGQDAGPPVLRPASAAVTKAEPEPEVADDATLLVADLERGDAPTVAVASAASPAAPPSPKLKPASQKSESPVAKEPQLKPASEAPVAEEPAPEPVKEPVAPEPQAPEPKAPEPAPSLAEPPTETAATPEQRAACLGACDGVLKYLLRHKHAAWFAEPVDAVALGIPHYVEVIKMPMDLGTVKGKYKGGRYASAEAFAADVRLVFGNAKAFNTGADEPVHVAAVQLGAKFEERFGDAMEDALYESEEEEEEEEEPRRRR